MTIRISKTHFLDRGEFSAEKLAQEVLANYTFGDIHPNVIVEEDEIVLLYDLPQHINKLFDTICEECNRQHWDAALILCDSLLEVLPIHVDTLRIKAQVMMTKQNFTDALTLATKAVTLNPRDVYALLLLGNIHNHMGDYKSAIKCYQEVSILKPDDQIVLCNIGSIYLKQEQYEQAICFFEDALKIDSTYANTYLGLAQVYELSGDSLKAFETLCTAFKKSICRPENKMAYDQLLPNMLRIAKKCINQSELETEIEKEKAMLEELGNMPIHYSKDASLKVYAQMRYAKTRGRNYHEIVYNPMRNPLLISHYVIHEFMHLEMAIKAASKGKNRIVYSNNEQTSQLKQRYFASYTKLAKTAGKDEAANIIEHMINGMLLQVLNCGLDALVEQKIYQEHPCFRPLQFLSIHQMIVENIEGLNQVLSQSAALFPTQVVSVNRTLNYVTATAFKDLFGVDLTSKIKLTPREEKVAKNILTEMNFYLSEGYDAGDEYDLVGVVAEEVELLDFLNIVNENEYNISPEEALYRQTEDAAKLHPVNETIDANQQFYETHSKSNPAETMMMSMYMLGAMQDLDKFSARDVHKIAIEIAMVGVNGISPNNKGYKIPSLPNREFGGYEFLAWYYVSWARAIPEKLSSLGLPFHDAYESALQLYNKKKS